jgi:hypothetical protein
MNSGYGTHGIRKVALDKLSMQDLIQLRELMMVCINLLKFACSLMDILSL